MLSIDLTLIKDINTTTTVFGGNPQEIVEFQGGLYYFAKNPSAGAALWKSDGTDQGSMRVINVRSQSNAYPRYLRNAGGTLFFRANDSSTGYELWKSDGTASGTTIVADLVPGPNGSDPRQLTNVSGILYFTDGASRQLWKSDGTAAGTTLIRSFSSNASSPSIKYLTNVNGVLFFAGYTNANGFELWRTDGTVAGTTLVRDIRPTSGSSEPRWLTNLNGALYFSADDGIYGRELWRSDGTEAGTRMVSDLRPDASSSPTDLTAANGLLYFSATDNATGTELWISDGTAEGTTLLSDINPGTANSLPKRFYSVSDSVFFTAVEGNRGRELWKTDGTEFGTVLVKDIRTNFPSDAGSDPSGFINLNGELLFAALDSTRGRELWKSDGTPSGTEMVRDIREGIFNGNGSYPTSLTEFKGILYFSANNGVGGPELWRSDASTSGTSMVVDIPSPTGSLIPSSFAGQTAAIGSNLYFPGNDGTHGIELWKSDGTIPGTMMVRDITPLNSSLLSNLTAVGTTLFFAADTPFGAGSLWKSDGTSSGTMMVKDINTSSTYWGNDIVSNLTNVNGVLFFTAFDNVNGFELWKSDGTTTGTMLVRDMNQVGFYNRPSSLTNVAGTLFFVADDGEHGYELWMSDGTGPGTTLVKDIFPGPEPSANTGAPFGLTSINDRLYFAANDGSSGKELWTSDGSAQGTQMIADIMPGFLSSGAAYITNLQGSIFFTATDQLHGRELWKTDGTAAGTQLVSDIRKGSASSSPRRPTSVLNRLFFGADDDQYGTELWVSDGTETGTVRLTDATPGIGGSSPGSLVGVGGKLFFVAIDPEHGRELWASDGTITGTVLVEDFWDERYSGVEFVPLLAGIGSRLFVGATDGLTGRELWSGHLDPLPGDFNVDGALDTLDIDQLVAAIAAMSHSSEFDMNRDGLVDLLDRDAWLEIAGQINLLTLDGYRLGDADLDGAVDGSDFIAWNANKFTTVAAWSAGDFTADGVVDGQDFIIWNTHKFTSSNSRGPVSVGGVYPVQAFRAGHYGELDRRGDHCAAKKRSIHVDMVFALIEPDLPRFSLGT